MSTQPPPHIFISYHRGDLDWVRQLSSSLEGSGFSVFDGLGIPGSDAWQDPLWHEAQARDVFIPIISPSAEDSSLTREILKQLDRRDINILPILIHSADLPDELAGRQFIRLAAPDMPGTAELRDHLKTISLDLLTISPIQFQRMAEELFHRYGYRPAEDKKSIGIGRARADMVLTYRDPLSLAPETRFLVEVKSYKADRPSVNAIHQLGVHLRDVGQSTIGVLFTNSQLTSVAQNEVHRLRGAGVEVRVIDGIQVRRMLAEQPDIAARYLTPLEAGESR